MNERDLAEWSALEVARRVQQRELSAVEVTQAALARVERLNPKLNAFITVTPEQALEEAARVDAATASGQWAVSSGQSIPDHGTRLRRAPCPTADCPLPTADCPLPLAGVP